MKKILTSIIFLTFTACATAPVDSSMIPQKKMLNRDLYDELDFPSDLDFEVTDLYIPTKVIPKNDTLIIQNALIARGYLTVKNEKSKWGLGPLMITIEMKKGKSECTVHKFYYSDYDGHYGQKLMQVTEAIRCNHLEKPAVKEKDKKAKK